MKDGISLLLITSSNRLSSSFMLGVVCIRYVSLCLKPIVKQQYAAWGSTLAIGLNTSILDIHCDTISSMYCFLNVNIPITDPRNLLPEFVIFTLVSLKKNFRIVCVSDFVTSHDFVVHGSNQI